jgi:vancomycin aglycone glucosyltransferase
VTFWHPARAVIKRRRALVDIGGTLQEPPMKIAVTAEGTRGDIYPMLALAQRIEARGDEVVFCAPPDFEEATTACGLSFRSVGRDIREYLTAEASSLHGSALRMARAAGELMKDNVGRQFADLRAAATGCDGILSAGTQIAASSVAEHLGVGGRVGWL